MFNFSRPTDTYYRFFDRPGGDKFGAGYRNEHEPPEPTERDQILASQRAMDQMRSPTAEAFNMLFEPGALLTDLYYQLLKAAGLKIGEPFFAIHLRTGIDFSNDNNRLKEAGVLPSFECVSKVEEQ